MTTRSGRYKTIKSKNIIKRGGTWTIARHNSIGNSGSAASVAEVAMVLNGLSKKLGNIKIRGSPLEYKRMLDYLQFIMVKKVSGNDSISMLCYRACDLFDVQFTFVMYTYLHRKKKNRQFKLEKTFEIGFRAKEHINNFCRIVIIVFVVRSCC